MPPVSTPPIPPPVFGGPMVSPPTPHQQSIGTIVSILIIVLMIIVGAFYAWGKRIAEERSLVPASAATSTSTSY